MPKKILILFFLIIIVFIPSIAIESIASSYELTTQVLLPALFPAMLLTQIILNEKNDNKQALGASHLCSFIPLISLCVLAGIPAASMLLDIEFHRKHINIHQLKWLVILTSNVSFSFVANYITTVERALPLYMVLVLFYLPPLINSCVYFMTHTQQMFINSGSGRNKSAFSIPVANTVKKDSLNNIFIRCTKSMTYIFIFVSISMVIVNTIKRFTNNITARILLSCIVEITTSCNMIKSLDYSFIKLILLVLCMSFGGICGILQMKSAYTVKEITLPFLIKIKMLNTLTALSIFMIIHYVSGI